MYSSSLSSQMTTPETRRVQTDRKSSFLDNIGERSEQLAEERREQQLRRRRGREGGRGGKTVKRSSTVTRKVNFDSLACHFLYSQ